MRLRNFPRFDLVVPSEPPRPARPRCATRPLRLNADFEITHLTFILRSVLRGRRAGFPRDGQAGRALVHAARQGVRSRVRGFRNWRIGPRARRGGSRPGDGGGGGGGRDGRARGAGGPTARPRGLLHRHPNLRESREVHRRRSRRRRIGRRRRGLRRARRGREAPEGVHRVGEEDARARRLREAQLPGEDLEVSGRSGVVAVGDAVHDVHARAHRLFHHDVLHGDVAAVLRARDGVHVQVVHHGSVLHRVLHTGVYPSRVVHAES